MTINTACSVLINTAHRPEFLNLCLFSYYRQSRRDFEVIVADDGSDAHTLEVIEFHKKEAPFPIIYIRQPPEGHRRAEILNKGIAACRTDYIIFSDCDSLAPACFVEKHMLRRRPGRMLIGGRIKLNRDQTEALTDQSVRSGDFESMATSDGLRKLRWRHWKNIWEIWLYKKRRPHNLGLNMSLSMKDLEAVNGYDNFYKGWGNADGDLRERLKMVGVRPLSIWREVYIFHQWHPQIPRGEGNADYARRDNITAVAADGLAQSRLVYEQSDRHDYEAFHAWWVASRNGEDADLASSGIGAEDVKAQSGG